MFILFEQALVLSLIYYRIYSDCNCSNILTWINVIEIKCKLFIGISIHTFFKVNKVYWFRVVRANDTL